MSARITSKIRTLLGTVVLSAPVGTDFRDLARAIQERAWFTAVIRASKLREDARAVGLEASVRDFDTFIKALEDRRAAP